MLLERGVNINTVTADGATPLYLAAQNDHVEIVKMLLEKEADVNKVRANGATPLFIAAQNGHVEVVKIVLAAKANMSIHFKTTVSSLREWANSTNVTEPIERLIIQKNATDELFTSPLEIAEIMGHLDIIVLLKNSPQLPCNSHGSRFFSQNAVLPTEPDSMTPECDNYSKPVRTSWDIL